MSVRLPGIAASSGASEAALNAVDTEIIGEIASSLGNAGRKVESSMQKLRLHAGDDESRALLVKAATEAVYAYFVQRELCGLRRHDDVIREYGIPREVLVRLGAK
jgi:hypothetical protein